MLLVMLWGSVLATVLLLPMVRRLVLILVASIPAVLWRDRLSALEVDVYPAGILLCAVLETQFATQLLHLGLELLNVVRRVVALADNSVQVCLATGLIRANALLENALRLFDELSVKVDAVTVDTAGGIVLAEDVVGSLAVVFLHLGIVGLALVGQFLCSSTVAIFVGAFRLGMSVCKSRLSSWFNVHVRSSRRACQLRHGQERVDYHTRALLLGFLRGERLPSLG